MASVRARPERERSESKPGPPRAGRDADFRSALESATKDIDDPVEKLRYIRGSLAKMQSAGRVVNAVPFASIRRSLYRWLSLEAVQAFVGGGTLTSLTGVDDGRNRRFQGRRARVVVGAMVVLLGVSVGAWRLSRGVNPEPTVVASNPAPTMAPQGESAEGLPILPPAVTPAGVWLVEQGAGFEQYSNGLRIDTTFTRSGDPRQYQIFRAPGGLQPEVQLEPVGILFHTSESDVWPLEANFNESLRDSSQRLLTYLKRVGAYNYLIDRFGRVYRVIDDASKANHAGNSIWEDEGRVYLNLNHAFIAVSFESRWDGGRALPITQAQLAAGRNLTEWLRQKYKIAPSMCVTHGLTSVNPKTHLIGHHLDWARGFPFEAFGVPDQYRRPPPSVATFGFSYDEDFLKVLGEPWPGIREAERMLAADATRQGRTVGEIRRERQHLYDEWLEEQARAQEAIASARGDEAQGRGPGG